MPQKKETRRKIQEIFLLLEIKHFQLKNKLRTKVL